ncbi:MAG TPA: DUF4149 domain-containing protein [Gammaproteobacteria bacterium]|nr:DUF4149 domain-containing protein [Gammaproteobacteria bacterium]
MQNIERILLTLWVGGMWAIGYLAVPVLFAMLEDRMLAGMLAGRMFSLLNLLGLFCGGALLAMQLWQRGRALLRDWQGWLLPGMLLVILAGEFILQPQMAALKLAGLEGERLQQFRLLHGISSLLFLGNSLAGLWLVFRGPRKHS